MPIYCCFYISWFCFTNWKQIKGIKTLCLVQADHASNTFLIHVFLFISVLLFQALGDGFYTQKKVIFI